MLRRNNGASTFGTKKRPQSPMTMQQPPVNTTFGISDRYFSSNDAPTEQTEAEKIGQEVYERAMEAFDAAKAFQEEREEKRNRQQYDAYQKSKEADAQTKSTIRGGVAVVKTIVKQTKKSSNAIDDEKEQELLQTAQSLLEEAALLHGNPTALVRMGNAAFTGDQSEEGEAKAIEYYRRANSPAGWFNVGHLLWNKTVDVGDENYNASMEAFQKAIDLGDPDAMYFVGVQKLSQQQDEGDDSPPSVLLKQAHHDGLQLVSKAANKYGHSGALHYLALFYLQGSTVLGIEGGESTDEAFYRQLDAAADAGFADSLFLRGHGYYHGQDGRPENPVKALENFLQAAVGGHADAAISAGAMLHQGVPPSIAKDQQRAFELYQLAGELGSKEGWRNVAACYALGEGVKKSKETADYIAKTMLLREPNEEES